MKVEVIICAALVAFGPWGCGSSTPAGDAGASSDETAPADTMTDEDTVDAADTDGSPDSDTDAATDSEGAACEKLFGVPNGKTGLDETRCVPECTCGGLDFTPPTYTEEEIDALAALVLDNPLPAPAENPYDHPAEHQPVPGTLCGLILDPVTPGHYRLETFTSEADLVAAGARLTHTDACGVCSPLVNLAVYMRRPDLTDPVRRCGLDGLVGGEEGHLQCLRDLGFDEACARIWYHNTKHTQAECLAPCMAALDAPYHNPDGSLNACLQCDETKSGAVFKAVAGRTRRNTGLPSSMCRPCSEVVPIVHDDLAP